MGKNFPEKNFTHVTDGGVQTSKYPLYKGGYGRGEGGF